MNKLILLGVALSLFTATGYASGGGNGSRHIDHYNTSEIRGNKLRELREMLS